MLPKRCPPCAKKAKYEQSQASKDRQWATNPEYRRKERERRRKQMNEWRAKNPERARENDRNWKKKRWAEDPEWRERQIAARLSYRYGFTVERYYEMIEEQGGLCAICRQPPAEGERLHVDHDHACCDKPGPVKKSCGKCVRGLLCESCNHGLGRFTDDPKLLRAAADYLEHA